MNKISSAVTFIFLFCFISSVLAQTSEPNVDEISSFIENAFKMNMTPSISVGVVKGDKIIYSGGFGVADISTGEKVSPETLFYIASTTKSFTAFAAAMLDYENVLDLDAPFTKFLHGFKFNTSLKDSIITLRDLLTHTHGIEESLPIIFRTAYTGEFTDQLLLDLLKNTPPSANGRSFKYGNLGYNITGLVMDEFLGKHWQDVLDEKIFKPLGMNNTTAFIPSNTSNIAMPHRALPDKFEKLVYAKSNANMHAAGGHVTTVIDLCKWLRVHINNGKLNNKQIFPACVVEETHEIQTLQDRNYGKIHRHGWGLGWDIGTYEGDTLIHRFGGFAGFHSHVSFMPDHKIGVVVLVNNGSLGSYFAEMIAQYIYDYMLNKPSVNEKYDEILTSFKSQADKARTGIAADYTKRAARSQVLQLPIENYTGEFTNPELGKITITLVDDKLKIHAGIAQSDVEVYNAEKNQLRVELTGSGEVISFIFDEDKQPRFIYNSFEFVKSE